MMKQLVQASGTQTGISSPALNRIPPALDPGATTVAMFVAATAGTLVPLGLRAMKIDPALASSVFITTLTDVFGFFAFLGLGHLFLRHLRVAG